MLNDRMSTINKRESNVRSYVRNFPAVFDSASGSWLSTDSGDRFLDFFCSAGSLNYGHNNDVAISSMQAYLKKEWHIKFPRFCDYGKNRFH